ncbi:DSPc domain containing protein [Trichuris trichiura]|uniref:DSPc domain containing protein n=1 Tax=Trichuris trichiura TaxID=36087 RepID=A0A077Z9E7_TRITR|nr:DSPc domain containing protein [Trichuris trichiura]
MPKKGGIPDGWMNYTKLGDRIPGTPFIASKTPLSDRLCALLPSPDFSYTPQELVEKISNKGHTVRMVIDLTATNRYYDPQVFSTMNIEYVKIMTPGGGSVPCVELRIAFAEKVKGFKKIWKYSADDESVICVHCTHGVNRAGYFICKYLVQCEGWNAEEVIRQFEMSRSHKFDRQYLVEDILRADPSTDQLFF